MQASQSVFLSTLALPMMVSFTSTVNEYSANGSWILVKSFQLLLALYASTHPHGTYTGIDVETLLKVHPPIVGGVAALHVIEVKDEQPEKVLLPISVIELGILIELREEHPSKKPNSKQKSYVSTVQIQ